MKKFRKTSPDHPGLFRCPDCCEFKPRDMFSSNRAFSHGICSYCSICESNRKKIKVRSKKSHPFRANAKMVECVLCHAIKPGPLMWRFSSGKDPVCIVCKNEYCNTHNCVYVPQHFIIDGKRKCCRCKTEKQISEFHKSSHSKTGLSLYCVECTEKMIVTDRIKKGKPVSGNEINLKKQKRCSKCGGVFYLRRFNIDKAGRDGYSQICKPCVRKYNQIRYKRNGNAYTKAWGRKLAVERPLSLSYWKFRIKCNHFKGLKPEDVRDLFIKNPHCWYCRIALEAKECQLDHKIPHSRGGPNVIENMAISCGPCNRAKWSMGEFEFKNWLERLRVRLNGIVCSNRSTEQWNITEILTEAI